MAEPSWKTSTLSQAFIGSLILYGLIMLLLAYGLIWKHLDVDIAKLIVGWASGLEGSLGSAYLTARKVNGEGNRKEPTPSTPPATTN